MLHHDALPMLVALGGEVALFVLIEAAGDDSPLELATKWQTCEVKSLRVPGGAGATFALQLVFGGGGPALGLHYSAAGGSGEEVGIGDSINGDYF